MRLNRHKQMPEAGFDITSMIDVVLLLTIFFMMSSQFSRLNQKPLDLPREPGDREAREYSGADAAIVIDLERDGRLSVAGHPYELPHLASLVASDIEQTSRSGKALDVIVRADRSTPAALLGTLASALGAQGVTDWRLATTGERGAGNTPSDGGAK